MAQTKISRLRVQDLGYQLLYMYRYNYKNQTTLQSHVLSSLHMPFTPPCTRHKMESTGKATHPRTVSKTKGLIEEASPERPPTSHLDRQTDSGLFIIYKGASMAPCLHRLAQLLKYKPPDTNRKKENIKVMFKVF